MAPLGLLAGNKGTILVRPIADGIVSIDGDFSDWPLTQFGQPAEQPPFPEGLESESNTARGDHIEFDKDRVGFFNGSAIDDFDSPTDFGNATYFAYDSQFFYMLAVFVDDEFRVDRDPTEFGSNGFLNDGFEFFLDMKGDSDDCASDDAFPAFDEEEPNTDDLQITVGLNDLFRLDDANDDDLGARMGVERGGNFDIIGDEKNGPGGLFRDALDKLDSPNIAARKFDDLRAAGAQNPEVIAANSSVRGYSIELRIPFGFTEEFASDHAMGFSLFWRDGDEDDGPGGAGLVWMDYTQNEVVNCDGDAGLFHTATWANIEFDAGNPLGGTPIPFEITEVTRSRDGMVKLTWNSKPGRNYTLLASSDLQGFEFEIADSVESAGATTSFTFPSPMPEASAVFMRVQEN
jgi:hypothetical protein